MKKCTYIILFHLIETLLSLALGIKKTVKEEKVIIQWNITCSEQLSMTKKLLQK